MKILITGGFGYLGGRLAQHLYATGADIILGTRTSASPPKWLPSASVAVMSWSSDESLAASASGADAIVHLAVGNSAAAEANPTQCVRENASNTKRLLAAVRATGVSKFVYVSTAHVYGGPLTGTLTEDSPAKGTHPYALAHLVGEKETLSARAAGFQGAVVARLSNSFGAPADSAVPAWTLFLNDVTRQMATTRRASLASDGLQRRDFIPMRESCRAIAHLILSPAASLPALLNVGSGWAPTLWEAAQRTAARCSATLGFKPHLDRREPAAGRESMPLDYRTDRLLATGFDPQPDADAELDELLLFCRRNFS